MTDQAALAKALQDTLQIDPAVGDRRAWPRPACDPTSSCTLATVPKAAYLHGQAGHLSDPRARVQGGQQLRQRVVGLRLGPAGHRGPDHRRAAHQDGSALRGRGPGGPVRPAGRLPGRRWRARPSSQIRVIDPTITDPTKQVVAVVHQVPGQAPVPLQTTIDVGIQQAADAALAGVAQPSALVAIDGSGNVRAVVSGPAGTQFDRALYGVYPPGSTFKVITTDGLLTAGLTPTSTLTCPSTVTVDGKVFHNFESESRRQPAAVHRLRLVVQHRLHRRHPGPPVRRPAAGRGSPVRLRGDPEARPVHGGRALPRLAATRCRPRPTPSARARSPPAPCRWQRWPPRS